MSKTRNPDIHEMELPAGYWHVCGVIDLGRTSHTCDICQEETVRFVISLFHEWCDVVPRVGRTCAVKMCNDPQLAIKGEQALMERASNRDEWVAVGWKMSTNGNPCRPNEGITVFKLQAPKTGWKFCINGKFSKGAYGSDYLAKLAAYDELFPPALVPKDRLHLAARPDWENVK